MQQKFWGTTTEISANAITNMFQIVVL